MQPLIDAGYVYIAKPPLYKITQGRKETYIEKESELEELLMADKWEKFQIFDRHGTSFKLTEPRWQKYARLLKQYEGWASSLRAEYGHEVVTYLEESQVLDEQVESAGALEKLLGKTAPEGEPLDTEVSRRPARPTSCSARWSARRGWPRRTTSAGACSSPTTTASSCACTVS